MMRIIAPGLVAFGAALSSCSGAAPHLEPAAAIVVEQKPAPASPAEQLKTAARAPRPIGRRARKAPVDGVLNVNRATEAELRLLPGIGKGRAAAIVQRRALRPFESLDEVARIRGLKTIVRRLRPHLTVSGDTTLRPSARDGPAS
jgi:DNA uptake protein ComE-like DNA-binding protein